MQPTQTSPPRRPPSAVLTSGYEEANILEHTEGHCSFHQFLVEHSIHANDSIEKKTAHEQFPLEPKLTVAVMLDGDLDAAVDGHPLCLSANHGPAGYLWITRQPARLDRWIRAGQRIRKITVGFPMENLASLLGSHDSGPLAALLQGEQAFTVLHWQPNALAISQAEELLTANLENSAMHKLRASMVALSLTHQALTQASKGMDNLAITPRDAKRARLARDYILEHIHQIASANQLARGVGMSVSTLQRLFKKVHGVTVMEFVRIRRLELARLSLIAEGLTVGEAAYRAGYSGTANFSTAFQREFGYSPSHCAREVGPREVMAG